jgi:hypothetical protein
MAVSRDVDAAGADRWAPGLAWLLWALTLSGLAAAFWVDHLLRRAGHPELTIRAHELTYVAAMAGMATVGAVLAGRRPRHPVGWLMLALGLSVTLDGVTDSYARYGLLASPGAVPAVGQVACSGTRSPSGRPASASSCCSRRPARCRRPAGDGGPGSPSSRH